MFAMTTVYIISLNFRLNFVIELKFPYVMMKENKKKKTSNFCKKKDYKNENNKIQQARSNHRFQGETWVIQIYMTLHLTAGETKVKYLADKSIT